MVIWPQLIFLVELRLIKDAKDKDHEFMSVLLSKLSKQHNIDSPSLHLLWLLLSFSVCLFCSLLIINFFLLSSPSCLLFASTFPSIFNSLPLVWHRNVPVLTFTGVLNPHGHTLTQILCWFWPALHWVFVSQMYRYGRPLFKCTV